MLYDVLSLWEIAHRWHDQDPNTTDPKALPLKVQDTLRFLTRAMWRHELRICSHKGIEHDNEGDLESHEEIIARHEDSEKLTPMEQNKIYEDYLDWHNRRVKFHGDAVEGFDDCFDRRIYDKDRLDSTYTPQHGLAETCQRYNIPLPAFWYSGNEGGQTATTTDPVKLRPNQIDRQLCESIARTLWDEHPDWNIVQITEHRAIQIYGNGVHYTADTLRDWVKEFDPRPEDKRRGRPKKNTGGQSSS